MPRRLLPGVATKRALITEPDKVIRLSARIPDTTRVVDVELVLLLGEFICQIGSWSGGMAHLAGLVPACAGAGETQALPVAGAGGAEVRRVLDPVVAAETVGYKNL